MDRPGAPRGETTAAASGLLLYAVALWLHRDAPGPGPLAAVCGLAALHAVLLGPACGPRGGIAWAFLPLLLALPALTASSYGHPGAGPLVRALGFVGVACIAGAVPRALGTGAGAGLYLPTAALLFALPPVLRYLALEFSGPAAAEAWGGFSPYSGAALAVGGPAWPWGATALLLAWPAWALAVRGLRR